MSVYDIQKEKSKGLISQLNFLFEEKKKFAKDETFEGDMFEYDYDLSNYDLDFREGVARVSAKLKIGSQKIALSHIFDFLGH